MANPAPAAAPAPAVAPGAAPAAVAPGAAPAAVAPGAAPVTPSATPVAAVVAPDSTAAILTGAQDPPPTIPSATPTPAVVDPTTGVPPGDAAWTALLDADNQNYVQTKGFKDPSAIVSSYRNLEKLVGNQDSILQIPAANAEAKEWGTVYDKLGRPEKAEAYKLNLPENSDEGFVTWAKDAFHAVGLSDTQAGDLSKRWNEHMAGLTNIQVTAETTTFNEQNSSLKSEWGADFTKNTAIAQQAARGLEVTPAVINGLEKTVGHAETMKFMHKLGLSIGEDSFVDGKLPKRFGGLTPEMAQAQITALTQDKEFAKKYADGDTKCKEEMDRLHKIAHPGTVTLT